MIRTGARSSPLSRAQFEEVARAISLPLEPVWIDTTGDLDQQTSLRTLDKTDFFTRELDQLLLAGKIQVAIHSAKDLPDPLPQGLALIALTRGIDPRDALVLRPGETLQKGFSIATSSLRREEAVRQLCLGLTFLDLRGPIHTRLAKLDTHEADGVVVAEAALVRLGLTHLNRIFLPGETTPNQGRLAIVARSGDRLMRNLFSPLHYDPLPRP